LSMGIQSYNKYKHEGVYKLLLSSCHISCLLFIITKNWRVVFKMISKLLYTSWMLVRCYEILNLKKNNFFLTLWYLLL
jgi:hypothetical protein